MTVTSALVLVIAICLTWRFLKAVFLPKTYVEENVRYLKDELGDDAPEEYLRVVAERHRVEFMPEQATYAAIGWLAFAAAWRASQ